MRQVADELYPETIEKAVGDDDEEDVDMETMLERELAGMKKNEKSKRFSELIWLIRSIRSYSRVMYARDDLW